MACSRQALVLLIFARMARYHFVNNTIRQGLFTVHKEVPLGVLSDGVDVLARVVRQNPVEPFPDAEHLSGAASFRVRLLALLPALEAAAIAALVSHAPRP